MNHEKKVQKLRDERGTLVAELERVRSMPATVEEALDRLEQAWARERGRFDPPLAAFTCPEPPRAAPDPLGLLVRPRPDMRPEVHLATVLAVVGGSSLLDLLEERIRAALEGVETIDAPSRAQRVVELEREIRRVEEEEERAIVAAAAAGVAVQRRADACPEIVLEWEGAA